MSKKSSDRKQADASEVEQIKDFLADRFVPKPEETSLFSLSDPDDPLDSVEAIEEYVARIRADIQLQIKDVAKTVTSLDKAESLIFSALPLLQEKMRNALLSCPTNIMEEYLERNKQKEEQERLAKEASKKAKRESRKSKGNE